MPKTITRKRASLAAATEQVEDEQLEPTGQTRKATAQAGRIMYIERKAGELARPGRIGRVRFSKTGRTLYYGGLTFRSLKGAGFKSNYFCVETGEDYWISGPKRRGGDGLYATNVVTEIDEDVREEYWREIRKEPRRAKKNVA